MTGETKTIQSASKPDEFLGKLKGYYLEAFQKPASSGSPDMSPYIDQQIKGIAATALNAAYGVEQIEMGKLEAVSAVHAVFAPIPAVQEVVDQAYAETFSV